MQSLRYKENRKAVSERGQEQWRAMLYKKVLICASSGFGILIFLYEIKGKETRYIVKSKYPNSKMQSLRYKENRKAVSERRQEQTSATLYRKILISWSSGFGILIFLYQIKGKETSFILKSKYQNSEMQAWDTRKTLRQYQKECRNDEARCCTGKCSYSGHQVSEF